MTRDEIEKFSQTCNVLRARAEQLFNERIKIYGYKYTSIDSIEFEDGQARITYRRCSCCGDRDFEYVSLEELFDEEKFPAETPTTT